MYAVLHPMVIGPRTSSICERHELGTCLPPSFDEVSLVQLQPVETVRNAGPDACGTRIASVHLTPWALGMDNYAATTLNAASPSNPTKPKRGRPPKNQSPVLSGGVKKAFPCDYCPRSFGRRSDMTRHVNVHTGLRPHACKFEGCDKSFIQTSALTVHMRTHTGEKPHCCSEEGCDKRFSDSSSLARHRKTHKKPFQCAFGPCPKGAMTWDKLHDHMLKAHKAVQYIEQAISPTYQGPDLFKYRRNPEGRIFAIPLRITQSNSFQTQVSVDVENCQENVLGPGDWVAREETPIYDSLQQPLAHATYPMGYQQEQTAPGSYALASAQIPSLGVEPRQPNQNIASAAATIQQFPGPFTQMTHTHPPLLPAPDYPMMPFAVTNSYNVMPQNTGLPTYARSHVHGGLTMHAGLPASEGSLMAQNVSSTHGLPNQQVMPVSQAVQMPLYGQGMALPVGPSLVQQGGNDELGDERRVSYSTNATHYSDQSDLSGEEFQDYAHTHAYGVQTGAFRGDPQTHSRDLSHRGSSGEVSMEMPELSDSGAPSPAEDDGDYEAPTAFGDEIKELMDTNGYALPSQQFPS